MSTPKSASESVILEPATKVHRQCVRTIEQKWHALRPVNGKPNMLRRRFLKAWGLPVELATEDSSTVAAAFQEHISRVYRVRF